MNKNTVNNKVVCFGEVLWDVFDGSHLPGGAPLNVAYHLNKLGVSSTVISRVGKDELGERLIDVINNWDLDSSNCQIDTIYPTSEVLPIVGADHEVWYDIKFPVAWDFIAYQDSFEELLTDTDAFIFGSLVARDEISRHTLLKLLKLSAYNVFDVNLRDLHYQQETILELLVHTHLLKMNQNEMGIIMGWLNKACTSEGEKVKFLQDKFNIKEILITKGAKGAVYYNLEAVFYSSVYTVEVKDTVGSGDAYLASFISGKLKGLAIEQNLKQAAALSAFVASSTGACPSYSSNDLQKLIDSPIQLNAANLSSLPKSIKIPTYNRKNVQASIAHIGLGAFHRAHQAYFTNCLLETGPEMDCGICGIALLKADKKIYDTLTAQDGLYTLMVPNSDGIVKAEVIGSIVELLFAPNEPQAVIRKLADHQIKVITLTITEGGYNFTADGQFNWDNKDVQWDIKNPEHPKTVFGYLFAALKMRRALGNGPLTILSCDNIEHNGRIARSMLYAYIQGVEPELINWIAENVSFPNSMVDRITPATSEMLKADLGNNLGLQDAWPVISESFHQWIIEDAFMASRPEWEKVGAQLVPDVTPYEKMKIRLLNGGHTLVGLAGYLMGYQYIHESVADPLINAFLKKYMDEEVSLTLDIVHGIDLEDYKKTVVERFKNPFIKDEVARIISGSSAKFPKFILPTVLDRLKDQQSVNTGALIVATWYQYLILKISDHDQVQDELAAVLLTSVQNAERMNDPLLFLANTEIFGDIQTYPFFTKSFLQHTQALRSSALSSRIENLT